MACNRCADDANAGDEDEEIVAGTTFAHAFFALLPLALEAEAKLDEDDWEWGWDCECDSVKAVAGELVVTVDG